MFINNKMQKIQDPKKIKTNNFIKKLYQMMEEEKYQMIIRWCQNGQEFEIINLTSFTEDLLPLYFNHSNFQTFIRQLYNYEFRKARCLKSGNRYYHKYFLRNQNKLLKRIKRKTYRRHKYQESDEQQPSQDFSQEIEILRSQEKQLQSLADQLISFNQLIEDQNKTIQTQIQRDRKFITLAETILNTFPFSNTQKVNEEDQKLSDNNQLQSEDPLQKQWDILSGKDSSKQTTQFHYQDDGFMQFLNPVNLELQRKLPMFNMKKDSQIQGSFIGESYKLFPLF